MAGNDMPITGGCLCGAIRYQADDQPYWVGYCHCDMCKRAVGGPFQVAALFRKLAVDFTQGAPTLYQSSESGERGFCGRCGTPILMQVRKGSPEAEVESALAAQLYPGFRRVDGIAITLGSLDCPEQFAPVEHIYAHRELPWLNINDGLPRDATGRGGPKSAE